MKHSLKEWVIKGGEFNGVIHSVVDGPVPEVNELITVISKKELIAFLESYSYVLGPRCECEICMVLRTIIDKSIFLELY